MTKLGGMPTLVSAAIGAAMSAFGGGVNFQVDPLNGKFMGTSILGHKIGGAFKESEISVVEDLFTKFQDTDEIIDTLAKSYDGLTDSTREYVREAVRAGDSSTEIIAGMKKANSVTGTLATSFKSLAATVGSMALSMVAAAFIGYVVNVITQLAQAQDKLNQSAAEFKHTIENLSGEISDYKTRVNELSKVLRDENSTTEEKVDARKQLLDIQKQLLNQYGKEETAVGLINSIIDTSTNTMLDYEDSINRVATAWENLELKAIEAVGRQSDAQDSIWQKKFNKFFYGTESSYRANNNRYEDYSQDSALRIPTLRIQDIIEPGSLDKLNKLKAYMNELAGEAPRGVTYAFEGSAEEIAEIYENIYAYAKKIGFENDSWLEDLKTKIDEVNNLIDNTRAYRDAKAEAYISGSADYSDAKEFIDTKYEEYNQAIAKDDKVLAEKISQQIQDKLSYVEEKAKSDGKDFVADWFEVVYAEIQSRLDQGEVDKWFDESTSYYDPTRRGNVQKKNQEIAQEYIDKMGISSAEDLYDIYSAWEDGSIDEADNRWHSIAESAGDLFYFLKDNNIEMDKFVRLAQQRNILDTEDEVIAKKIFGEGEIKLDNGQTKKWESQAIKDWINKLGEERPDDLSVLLTLELDPNRRYTIAELEAEIAKAKKDIEENPITISTKGITETVESLKDDLKPGLDAISGLWDKIFPEGKFDKANLKKLDVFEIVDTLKGITDKDNELAFKFDTETIDDLVEKLTSADTSAEELQDTLSQMQTIVINAAVDGTEDFQTLKNVLDNLYVDNSGLVAFNAVLQNADNTVRLFNEAGIDYNKIVYDMENHTLALKQANGELDSSEEAVVAAFLEEKMGADEAQAAIALLKMTKILCSETWLDESSSISELIELATAAGIATDALVTLQSLQSGAAQVQSWGQQGDWRSIAEYTQQVNEAKDGAKEWGDTINDQINARLDETRKKLDALGNGGGGGGGAKDAADDTKDLSDALSEASKSVDDLQDAYSKLLKIQESYNKNGKLTVDQAQELMQMDFHYLSMLKLENGVLKVNEQAFKSTTQAKLEEMKITMMRNALNTMQSITTEAQAEAYLAMCTAEANMATGEAVALQAALESQMQGTTGAIADAYNMIYQGLQNAMAMLGEGFGNVDFSSLATAAEDSTKDVAQNAEEEFEEVFDWLERRMTVLQKKADLFAAKRANADMTYFDRYTGYNGYLNKEINIYKQQKATAKEQVRAYTEEYEKAIEGLDEATVKAIEGNGKGIETITDKNMAEAIKKAIEWKDKIDDAKISIEEIQTKINDLSLDKFNYLADVIERKMKKVQRSLDFSDFYQGMLEATGYASSSSVYKSMADDYGKLALKSQKELQRLEAYRQKLIDRGLLTKNSKQDLEMQEKIAEVEKQVLDYTLQQAEAEKNARDAVRERFDYLQQIQDSYEDELNSINSLFYSDQAIDDEAHYTSTAYGMMATQQYAYASNLDQVQKYKQALAELEEQHRSGEIGAQEYQDREQSLRASMYESAEAAKAAKDAIIDLAKERIEKEISIIEDQIKAYSELINKQKQALKSAKDLHDYEKSIAESRDDLAKITRKLAAIENDTSQSATAQRKKLEQEYADAKAKLEEKEYQHSISTAEKNLDKQAEAYEEAKNVEIKRLQEKLKDVEALFSEATGELSGHMTEALQGMTDTLEKYGVSMSEIISNAIISGVQNGTTGSSQLLSGVSGVQNQYSNENDAEVAKVALEQTKSNFNKEQANYAGQLNSLIEGLYKSKIIDARVRDKWTKSNKEAGGWSNSVNSINEAIAANNYSEAEKMIQGLIDSMHKKKDQIKSSLSKAQREQLNAAITAVKNWTSKLKNRGFATGVHKLNKNELAWTQELGNEAILSPTRNAILTPLKSGDTVLTAAQTDNLFKMAKNPFDFLKDVLKVEKVQLAGTGGITMQIDNVLTVQGDVNDSNAKEMAAVAQQAITKAFNEFSSKIKK